MVEKTYVALKTFEHIREGDSFTVEETPRLAALVGVAYLEEVAAFYEEDEAEADEAWASVGGVKGKTGRKKASDGEADSGQDGS